MGRFWVAVAMLMLSVFPCTTAAGAQDIEGAQSYGPDSPLAVFNRDLVEKVKKSCIYISMMTTTYGYLSGSQMHSIGSGVIIMSLPEENAALAVTNHHVAESTVMLQITLWDHSTYKAEMLTSDPGIDAALIKIYDIPPDAYEPATLGNSDEVQVGEPALAIGAPGSDEALGVNREDRFETWGLHQSTTMRVVMGRQYEPYDFIQTWAAWRNDLGWQVMTNLPFRFSTNAPISGGNSGGPLFNCKGELIALNHAGAGFGPNVTQNENYSIPINPVKKLVFEYLDKGTYEIPWCGMDILLPANYTDPVQIYRFIERHTDLKRLEVLGVRKNSPAKRAGLEQGDIIVEFDGARFPPWLNCAPTFSAWRSASRCPCSWSATGARLN